MLQCPPDLLKGGKSTRLPLSVAHYQDHSNVHQTCRRRNIRRTSLTCHLRDKGNHGNIRRTCQKGTSTGFPSFRTPGTPAEELWEGVCSSPIVNLAARSLQQAPRHHHPPSDSLGTRDCRQTLMVSPHRRDRNPQPSTDASRTPGQDLPGRPPSETPASSGGRRRAARPLALCSPSPEGCHTHRGPVRREPPTMPPRSPPQTTHHKPGDPCPSQECTPDGPPPTPGCHLMLPGLA